jgi:hypothetical protein
MIVVGIIPGQPVDTGGIMNRRFIKNMGTLMGTGMGS